MYLLTQNYTKYTWVEGGYGRKSRWARDCIVHLFADSKASSWHACTLLLQDTRQLWGNDGASWQQWQCCTFAKSNSLKSAWPESSAFWRFGNIFKFIIMPNVNHAESVTQFRKSSCLASHQLVLKSPLVNEQSGETALTTLWMWRCAFALRMQEARGPGAPQTN
jgi:hypothetical protein